MAAVLNQTTENEWVTLPGGELEGRRPKTLCGPCRVRKAAGAPARAICFEKSSEINAPPKPRTKAYTIIEPLIESRRSMPNAGNTTLASS